MSVIAKETGHKLQAKIMIYSPKSFTWESPCPWSPLMVKLFLFGKQGEVVAVDSCSRCEEAQGTLTDKTRMESQPLATAHAHTKPQHWENTLIPVSKCQNQFMAYPLLHSYGYTCFLVQISTSQCIMSALIPLYLNGVLTVYITSPPPTWCFINNTVH